MQYTVRGALRRGDPQRRLMMAVLQTVLDDCRGTSARQRRGVSPADSLAYREARAYLTSPDRAWPFSFENICEAVGLDADAIRRDLTAK